MFATECSNPSATKAVIGKTMAMIFPLTVRALSDNHTARQTSVLHSTPRMKASNQGIETLPAAIAAAVSPTAPSPRGSTPDHWIIRAIAAAPMKLAT